MWEARRMGLTCLNHMVWRVKPVTRLASRRKLEMSQTNSCCVAKNYCPLRLMFPTLLGKSSAHWALLWELEENKTSGLSPTLTQDTRVTQSIWLCVPGQAEAWPKTSLSFKAQSCTLRRCAWDRFLKPSEQMKFPFLMKWLNKTERIQGRSYKVLA